MVATIMAPKPLRDAAAPGAAGGSGSDCESAGEFGCLEAGGRGGGGGGEAGGRVGSGGGEAGERAGSGGGDGGAGGTVKARPMSADDTPKT